MTRLLRSLLGDVDRPMHSQHLKARIELAFEILARVQNLKATQSEWRYIVNIINVVNVVDEFKNDPSVRYQLDSEITEEHELALQAIDNVQNVKDREYPRFTPKELEDMKVIIGFYGDICASGPERLILAAEAFVNKRWDEIDRQLHGTKKKAKIKTRKK